jgi:hypothetical protein
MDEDYSIGIHVLDGNQRVIGARDSYPGHGLLPTRLWRPGQIVQDTYWLPVAPDAPASGIAQIHISVYTREDKRDLPAFDPNGREVTSIVGQVKIGGNGNAASRPENETTFSFGKQITLAGYNWDRRNLILFWKKSAPVAEDYTVFVHVLDSSDNIVKQWDLQPGNGNDPTSLWEDGETVTDVYTVEVSTHGMYRVELGLYRPATMERLPVTDGKGAALGDHVTLGPFEVRP